jgi:hypothetical protein
MLRIHLSKAQVAGLVVGLFAAPVCAETIEAIGGERCGKPSKPYIVEFLAPEGADLQANAKVMIGGLEDLERPPPTLTLDGKSCLNGHCTFRASKGQTYTLAAKSMDPKFDNLCISVTRP